MFTGLVVQNDKKGADPKAIPSVVLCFKGYPSDFFADGMMSK